MAHDLVVAQCVLLGALPIARKDNRTCFRRDVPVPGSRVAQYHDADEENSARYRGTCPRDIAIAAHHEFTRSRSCARDPRPCTLARQLLLGFAGHKTNERDCHTSEAHRQKHPRQRTHAGAGVR